jgi:hypothetical protein
LLSENKNCKSTFSFFIELIPAFRATAVAFSAVLAYIPTITPIASQSEAIYLHTIIGLNNEKSENIVYERNTLFSLSLSLTHTQRHKKKRRIGLN